VSTSRARHANLPSQLRTASGLAGGACLILCLVAVASLAEIDRDVTRLAGGLSGQAVPASELMRQMENVALATSAFTRSRQPSDREAAVAAFAQATHRIEELRAQHATETGGGFEQLAETTAAQSLAWRRKFDDTAEVFLRFERSTRGLGAQCSLLTTVCTQLLTDDGSMIPGPRARDHRRVLTATLSGLNEIQNSVLFASSLLQPDFVTRARTRQSAALAELAPLLEATAPSDLRDFIEDVHSRVKDVGEELANLHTALVDSNRTQAELVAAGSNTLGALEPVVRRTMLETIDAVNHARDQLHRAVAALAVAGVLLPLAGWFAGRWFARRITRALAPIAGRLRDAAHETANETRGAESASRELAEVTRQQATALELVSGNATEVSTAINTNLETVRALTGRIEQTHRRAAHGEGRIHDLNSATADITRSSARIQEVVGSIEEIAFMTNLLALNAAIEAARAGEAGRGFAVVADEVRRLAQRSSAAAKETAELVTAAQTTTARGVEAAEHVGRDFQGIIEEIGHVRALLQQSGTASESQAAEVQSMTSSVRQLEDGTTESAAKADRFAQLATTLRRHATSLEHDAAELAHLLGTAAQRPVNPKTEAPAQPGPRVIMRPAGPLRHTNLSDTIHLVETP
jgi:methyl-accepting chemotaxis protein